MKNVAGGRRSGWWPVANDRGQCSVWPAARPLPPGWSIRGPSVDREEALAAAAAQFRVHPDRGQPREPLTEASTVDRRFARAAALHPDRVAVRDGDTELRYGTFAGRIAAARAGLVASGVGRGSTVGVCLDRGADMLAVLVGVLGVGAAYVPLDSQYPPARLAAMVADAGARCVVRSPEAAAALSGVDVASFTPEQLYAAGSASGTAPAPDGRPDDIAYVMYTSGSTGRPKGVEVTQRNLVDFLDAMVALLPPGVAERVLFGTRLSFDIAGLEIFLPLTTGGTCVVVPDSRLPWARRLATLVNAVRPSLVQATPVSWRLLLHAGARFDADQTLLCGGDVLPEALSRELARHPGAAFNMYGPTEATIWSTGWRIHGPRAAIGQALKHARAYVLDDGGNPVEPGRYGELYIGGPAVAHGYRGAARLTCERFVPDPWSDVAGARMYATGDIVRQVDGQLDFSHRRDTQVKVNGNRVELGEIESLAGAVPGVGAAVAVVIHSGAGHAVRLCLESTGEAGDVVPAVREHLARHLPAAVVPQQVLVVDALPVTANGKVDRGALSSRGA